MYFNITLLSKNEFYENDKLETAADVSIYHPFLLWIHIKALNYSIENKTFFLLAYMDRIYFQAWLDPTIRKRIGFNHVSRLCICANTQNVLLYKITLE